MWFSTSRKVHCNCRRRHINLHYASRGREFPSCEGERLVNLLMWRNGRELPPVVAVSFNEKSRYGQLTMLECHMYDFYSKDIAVTWLKDETVVNEGIFQSETMASGDWTYQFHSYLELVLQQGEKVSCQVEHSSFKKPLVVLWGEFCQGTRVHVI
ncbi:SLA class II histocompatibility antigen, DQ haplotype D beta chain-like [Colossoma macropomum]|uniref:SLA class II histocompatibility antigen, DQ haplotype D beta chain-like n=1 Tax=Colossoma macropomum TaxID=42526 RepID=UPI0018648883|nr:SLA class II histocompatibility antigen, DQ haplotype D beta chain-like [Colossoma macropomum]